YLLTCEALSSTKEEYAFTVFERLFKERGLPSNIRSDNGAHVSGLDPLFSGAESNRRATLKSRKLLILQIARNAKTAKNVSRGYAAATLNAARDFHRGSVGTQKLILATKTNQQSY